MKIRNTDVSHFGRLVSLGSFAVAAIPAVLTAFGLLVGPDRACGAEIIWAATTHGPHRSLDNGLTWEARQDAIAGKVGSLLQGGAQTSAVAIDPSDPNTVYFAANFPVSGNAGAVLKTTDGGETFTASLLLGTQLEAKIPIGQFGGVPVATLAIDPVAVNVIYLFDGDDPGTLLRSTDAGITWAPLSVTNVRAIAVDPLISGVVWANTRPPGFTQKFWRSEDFGDTWSEVESNASDLTMFGPFVRLFVDPLNSNTLYAYTGTAFPCLPNSNPQCGFLRSEDGGATWSSLGVSGAVISTAFNRSPPTYFAISDAPQFTVLRSDDGGQTWPPVALGVTQTVIFTDTQEYSAVFGISNAGRLVRSIDQGATWSQPLILPTVCDPIGPCRFGDNAGFKTTNAFMSLAFPSPAAGQRPSISAGGIVLGTLLPTVNAISPLSIISVFGQNFSTETILFPTLDEIGDIDKILGTTCLEMSGERLPIFAVTPTQINAQASQSQELGPAAFVVIANCDTENAVASEAVRLPARAISPAPQEQTSDAELGLVLPETPGFFIFDPIAADGFIATRFNSDNVAVAPDGMLNDEFGPSRPAKPGDIITLYGTGWGRVSERLRAGQLAPGAVEVLPFANPMVSFGGIMVAPEDIFYVGLTPQSAGLFQLVIAVPETAQPGNNEVVLTVYGKSTPVGPVVPVAEP